MQIFGHKAKVAYFKKLLESGKLADKYLFFGPEGVGKLRIAIWLALEVSDKNDILIVSDNPYLEKEFSYLPQKAFSKSLKIELIRETDDFLNLKPLKSENKKVLILDNFHLATVEAQNAFLKTLEDLDGDVLIFLITHRLNLVLETIKSRAQKVSFGLLADQEIEKILKEKGFLSEEIKRSINLFGGSAPRALKIASNFEEWRKRRKEFLKFFDKSVQKRFELAEFLLKNPDLVSDFFEEIFIFLKNSIKKHTSLAGVLFLRRFLNFYYLTQQRNLNFFWQLEHFILNTDRNQLSFFEKVL